MPRKNSLTALDCDKIIDLYRSGKPKEQVAREVNSSAYLVSKVLKARHVLQRKNNVIVNENFFDTVDTRQKAYFLGWLMSDGCNHVKRRRVSIGLKASDREILNKLKKYIGFQGNIHEYGVTTQWGKQARYASICICNTHLSESLEKLGCVARKTKVLRFPTEGQVPLCYRADFLRGYFEGDGTIGIYQPGNSCRFGLVANKDFLIGVAQVLKMALDIDVCPVPEKKSAWFYRIVKGGRKQVLQLLDWLYQDCGDMFLDRKYQIYLKMKAIVPTPREHCRWGSPDVRRARKLVSQAC